MFDKNMYLGDSFGITVVFLAIYLFLENKMAD